MARLFALVVAAAVAVPTAVLGRTSEFHGFSVPQVKRAFAAEGIDLGRDYSNPPQSGFADLVGRLRDNAKLDVSVALPHSPPKQSVLVYVSSSPSSTSWGSGGRLNVVVDWTARRCSDKRRVLDALNRLPLPRTIEAARLPIASVHCTKPPQYP